MARFGMFSINIVHFIPIRLQKWPPQAILVFDWFISKKLLQQMTDNKRRMPSDAESPFGKVS
jgi:hypothetical protein